MSNIYQTYSGFVAYFLPVIILQNTFYTRGKITNIVHANIIMQKT